MTREKIWSLTEEAGTAAELRLPVLEHVPFLRTGVGHRLLCSESGLGMSQWYSRMGGLIMAQGWTWPLEKILAELVRLFQVVKSRDQSGLPQVLGFGMGMPREGREVGNISIGLMENGRVVQGRVFL